MTLNLQLILNVEQVAALQRRVDEANLQKLPEASDLIPEAYLLRSLNAEIASYVEADFNAASQRLILASKSLPYEQRLAIIAQVENALTQA